RDSDGDNLISFEESGLDKDTFATIDADGDGLATSEEITASETERQQTIQSMLDAGDFEGVQALMGDMGPPPGMEGMTGMSMGDKGGGMIQMLANNAYSQGAQQGYNIDAMLLEQLDLAV
ncbi:MAG: hypothetical protein KKB70_11240, partial [Proteobacteria bacterium]|nr:hypothetical protein [Pseudomonadota bacterium]MBU1611778.1 hypothetical protein [Pseudomonadota bacterium]